MGIPPIAIYKSEEGFDMSYRRAGMWGNAYYFAKNSSYSNSYAFSGTGNGTRQILCAKVLIGKPCVQGPDRNLLRPPMNPGTLLAYDSV